MYSHNIVENEKLVLDYPGFYECPIIINGISTEDVLLQPADLSIVDRRSEVDTNTFIMNAPMATAYSLKMAKKMIELNQIVVVPRFSLEENRDLRTELLTFLLEEEATYGIASYNQVFYAVGLDDAINFIETAIQLRKDKALDPLPFLNICVDVAIGSSLRSLELYAKIRDFLEVKHLMSGSLATAGQANLAYHSGCDYLRIGVGGGSACKTRVETGVGIPTLSSVLAISALKRIKAWPHDVKLIADGGISNSGQIAKYLVAGANYVMSGRLFAETSETDGWEALLNIDPSVPFDPNQSFSLEHYKFMKRYAGQASTEFLSNVLGKNFTYGEGVGFNLEFNNLKLETLIHNLEYGLRSAASYLGINSFDEFYGATRFIKITPSGYKEGLPLNVHQ